MTPPNSQTTHGQPTFERSTALEKTLIRVFGAANGVSDGTRRKLTTRRAAVVENERARTAAEKIHLDSSSGRRFDERQELGVHAPGIDHRKCMTASPQTLVPNRGPCENRR